MPHEYTAPNGGTIPQVQLNDANLDTQFSFGEVQNPSNKHDVNHGTNNIGNPFRPTKMETKSTTIGGREFNFDLSRIIGTLPVLVTFPSLLLSYTLSYNIPTIDTYSIILSVVFANTFLLLFKLASTLKIININHKLDDLNRGNILKYLLSLTSLSLVYFTSKLLPIDRVVVLIFGFYLNQYNFYTLLAFCLDIYNSQLDNVWQVVLGYVLVVVAGKLLNDLYNENHHFISSLPLSFLMAVELLGLLLLIFLDFSNLNFSIIGVNIAVSSVSLFSLVDANLKSSRILLVILSFIASILQYIILAKPFDIFSILNVFLPLVISIDRSNDIELPDTPANREKQTNIGTFNSIIKELLSHSDTKAIFNFLLLNTTFMFIQLLYSFRSKSLGLLSDSLHMALDCTSLALGLLAGVLSKQAINPNGKFPFGLKNFEILAGFTNATLLIGISGSIIFEAIGRLFNPVSLQKTNELIIVSILGLLVNLVGIFAFNHGHDHSHGGHSHGHSHSHAAAPEESSHSHSHSHSHEAAPPTEESQGMNDNMKGIFLHILADTLGSVGVVISTLLTKFFGWEGFDPIASIIIALLIFFSALPLIKSTSSTLLLQLSSKKEIDLRDVLNEILTIKGVKSFTTPRFWPDEKNLQGYIHIQIYRDENANYIKKQCEKSFELKNINVMIQLEHDYDDCWCRRNNNLR